MGFRVSAFDIQYSTIGYRLLIWRDAIDMRLVVCCTQECYRSRWAMYTQDKDCGEVLN